MGVAPGEWKEGAQATATPRHGQPTTLIRGEREPTVACERRNDLLENPDFLLRVVQLALYPLVDRARDHRDEELERCRQHSSPRRDRHR
jgi:hypothetical protein